MMNQEQDDSTFSNDATVKDEKKLSKSERIKNHSEAVAQLLQSTQDHAHHLKTITKDAIQDAEDRVDYRIDQWYHSIEKIFEFFQVPLCYVIKISMIVTMLSTTCVFLAVCLIVSLKVVLIVEHGYITGNESSASSLFMLFGLLFIVLVVWSFATAMIVSRQIEVLYFVYLTPSTLAALKMSQVIAEEEDPRKQPFLRLTPFLVSKVPFPRFPTLSVFGIAMIVAFILAMIFYASGYYQTGNFFLILFFIFSTFICIWFTPNRKTFASIQQVDIDLNRPGNSMVSWAFLSNWVFMCIAGIATSILMLCSLPALEKSNGQTPGFAKIVLGFVGISAIANLLHVCREAWINPVYYIWVEFLGKFIKSRFRLKKFENVILGFGCGIALIGLLCGAVSFFLYISDADQDGQWIAAFISELLFVIINLLTCFAALYVYAVVPSTSKGGRQNNSNSMSSNTDDNDIDNDTITADDKIESGQQRLPPLSTQNSSSASVSPIHEDKNDTSRSAEGNNNDNDIDNDKKSLRSQKKNNKMGDRLRSVGKGSFQAILAAFQTISGSSGWVMTNFVFFMFMIGGLIAGGATASVWIQAIVYFLLCSVIICCFYYPIETKDDDEVDDEFWKVMQFVCIILVFLLVIILFPLFGTGVSTLFLLLIFSHGVMLLLFDLLLSSPFPIVSDKTIASNLKIYAGVSIEVAEFNAIQVSKYSDRTYKGIYGLAVVLNAIAFLLSTFAQTSPQFGAGGGSATVVEKGDVTVSNTPHYGLCSADLYSLNAIDTSYLVSLTYFKDPTNYSYDCGFVNETNLVKCLNNYFTPTYTKVVNNNLPYEWDMLNINIPKDNRAKEKTAYYGIKSDNANLIVVGVRGSTTGRDWLEDFNLYVEITMLQFFSSFVLPYIYVWPVEATAYIVKSLSYIDTLTFLNNNITYYEPVIAYIETLQNQYPTYDVTVVGHSLGGATAGIVGAKMGIRSFTFEPPGMIYSHLKFKITGGLQAIHQTSTSIVRDDDPVPMVDLQGGNIQKMTCPKTFLSGYCHMMLPISCNLMTNCQAMNESTFDHWGGGMKYCGF